MHHTLKFYSRYRESALRFYMFWAPWTRIPLVGRLVRWVANTWGRNLEGAYLLTTAEAEEVVDAASDLGVGPCTCRQVFGNCGNPVAAEIMLGLSGNVFAEDRPQDYRRVSKEEAKDILRQCHESGLVHSLIKCREDFYAICNCCTCCCVPLRLQRQYGIGNALARSSGIVDVFRTRQREVVSPGH